MNDHEIVEALRNRVVSGLTGLYDAYAEPLYAYCWSLLGDEGAAQEALGETFIVAEAHIEKLADPARLRVWLYAIARNECLRHVTGSVEPAEAPGPAPTGKPAEDPAGRPLALDELLSGGTSPRARNPAETPGVPGMMVAPGVLGVPGTQSAPPPTEAGEPEPVARDTEPDASAPEAEAGATATSPDAEAATPAIGIAAALSTGDGRPNKAPPVDTPPAGDAGAVGGSSPDDDLRQVVERVFGALPPAEGEMLDLAFRHGFEVADIAIVVGLPAHQVQGMLAHADQQVRSGLAVERLATGGRVSPPDLAARLERGDPPAAALLLSVRPPALPQELKATIIGTFTAPEKIGYRLYVGRRSTPFDKGGFPVPLDGAGASGGKQTEGGEPGSRGWRWPAAGLGVAACLAAVLAAVLLWPTGGTERATNAAAPGDRATGFPVAPGPSIDVTATATPSPTPSATPTQPSPGPRAGPRPGGAAGGDPRSGGDGRPGGDRDKPRPPKPKDPPSTDEPEPTATWTWPDPPDPPTGEPTDPTDPTPPPDPT